VMATGKSRGPWVQDVRRELGFKNPGYSLNGTYVYIYIYIYMCIYVYIYKYIYISAVRTRCHERCLQSQRFVGICAYTGVYVCCNRVLLRVAACCVVRVYCKCAYVGQHTWVCMSAAAVCCTVLHRVAPCCTVLHRVAVCIASAYVCRGIQRCVCVCMCVCMCAAARVL